MLQLRTGRADTDIIALYIRSMGSGLGGAAAHSTDAANFMFTPSATITAEPPRVTTAQCDLINPSTLTQFCPPALQVPPPRLGQIDRPSPVPERIPMPAPTLRTLLLTDEGEGIELVARMGQAVARLATADRPFHRPVYGYSL